MEPPEDDPPLPPLPDPSLPLPLPPELPPGDAPPDEEPSEVLVVGEVVVVGAGVTAAPEPPPGTVSPVVGAVSALGLLPPHAEIPIARDAPAMAVAVIRLRAFAEGSCLATSCSGC